MADLFDPSRRRLFLGGLALTAAGWRSASAGAGFEPFSGTFRLRAPDGRQVSDADLRGKPTLLFFGFMSCPDICPTTLLSLAELLKRLGPDAARVNAVFVSVDPERDDPKALGEFVASFDPHILGLTGDGPAVRAAVESYRAMAEKIPQGESYTIMHSTGVYLLDRDGVVRDLLDLDGKGEAALARVREFVF